MNSISGKKIGSFQDRWDFFATPVPTFNMEGHKQVGTTVGCVLSFVLTALVLTYGAYQAHIVAFRLKPNLSSITIENKH